MMKGEFSLELREAVSASLLETAVAMEDLGVHLCCDPNVTANFFTQLQALDLAAQTLRCNAEVISAEHPESAAIGVKLEQLARKFAQSLPDNHAHEEA